jgi:hypothetical protein
LPVAERCIPGIVETAGAVAAGHSQRRRTEDSLVVHRIVVVVAGSLLAEKRHTGSDCILHIAGTAVVRTEGTAEIGVGMTGRPVGNVPHQAGKLALFEGFRGLGFSVLAGRGGHPEHLYHLWENVSMGFSK